MVIYEGGHPKPPLVFEGSVMRGHSDPLLQRCVE
jgi:hypothetical protein